jgi:hypothetical protein
MLSGTSYPSGENYPAGAGMELYFYPHAGTSNPTGKILRVRVWVGTTRRVRTRCHLKIQLPQYHRDHFNYHFSVIFSLTLLQDPRFIWVLGEIY